MQLYDAFELKIISPKKTTNVTVTWIEVESPSGNFIVGPNHAALVSMLKQQGTLTYHDYTGFTKKLVVPGGIFRVAGGNVVVILDD